MPTASQLLTVQDVPPAPPAIEAPTTIAATPAPSPPPVVVAQEVTPATVKAIVPAT